MSREVAIIESTMRDGQQSHWALRMTTAMMLPILPLMDRAGFHTIEFMGTAVMDSCVRWLKENPWERIRLVRERVQQTPLGMITPVLGFSVSRGVFPDDVAELFFRCCVRNGIQRYFMADGLNDIRNFEVPLRTVKAAGASVIGAVAYSISPVHTDAHFSAKVQELVVQGADIILLKDPNGVLTPERVRTLIPALHQVAGDRPVFCHSHCVTGLGPATNLEAIAAGAQGTWTVATPLANGSSLPPTESMLRHLRRQGYQLQVDPEAPAAISEHFRQVAIRHQKPMGQPAEYDPAVYEHQMPGGMISNFRAQLALLGIEHMLDDVIKAMPEVRADLGWAQMMTPFSQIIATQAALNLLYGPYTVILDEVRRMVLGHYGRTPAPVSPALLDRAGGGKAPISQRPGALMEPALARFRAERGPFKSDEDLLLEYFFMPEQLREMTAAGPIKSTDTVPLSPLVDLIRSVATGRSIRSLRLVLPVGS